MTASIVGPDPLVTFLRAHTADKHPVPLVATRIDVTIRGGLARVATERTFRNDEKQSIEATMTFPVPVDATLCALSARIGERTLTAVAQARQEARATYESAVDQGKAAVLHEELLKGIHMLSVAHVQPGATIVVTDTWTAPLAFVGGTPQLRIPTTVGDIYGRSPLAPSDDLVTAEVVHEATIRVMSEDGVATIARAGAARDGSHTIRLDAPIDITVSSFVPRALEGIAADGRRVTLQIEPAPVADASLNIDLLFDRSGSMNERASSDRDRTATKYSVAKAGLMTAIGEHFKSADRMRLWEFNDGVHCVGDGSGTDCKGLVHALRGPDGGTQVGRAIEAANAAEKTGNIVVVTDGKSWALDPQRLARTGIRVTAVLIGEDALDAGISHLAGMTGGQSFVATSSDAGSAIAAAIAAARAPRTTPQPIEGKPMQVMALRRGARVIATWGEQTRGESSEQAATAEARQIGATAAMLAIPLMQESEAKALAEAEGVVCHLTSLVLVDEAGTRQGLPAVRKVALSAPAMARAAAMPAGMAPRYDAFSVAPSRSAGRAGGLRRSLSSGTGAGLRGMIADIDWDDDPEALCRGDLASLRQDVVAAIERAARLPTVVALAGSLGVEAVVVVIGLLAKAAGSASRSAQRIARTLLAGADQSAVAAAMAAAGL
jgi:Vault protein inter-alpha-trypsin domain/von Willebrand factor type A domain